MLLTVFVRPGSAGAQERPDRSYPRYEIFTGAGLTPNSAFGYFGGVWAFGRDVSEPGLRIKALGGTGRYGYRTTLAGAEVSIDGDVHLVQALAGYLWRRADWTVKVYAGAGYQEHDLRPDDPVNDVRGGKAGFIGQLELWRNLGSNGFLSLDGSYGSAFDSYWAQARLGRRLGGRFSAGLEAGALGNEEFDSGRGGGFIRFHIGDAEMTFSGGIARELYGDELSGYAAVGFYAKF